MKISSYSQLTDSFYNFHDSKIQNEVRQYQVELKRNRLSEIQNIVSAISELRENIQNLKADVYNTFFHESSTVEKLHKNMFKVEDKITQIIQTIQKQFLLLSDSEKVLCNELISVEQRIKSLFKPLNPKLLLPIKLRISKPSNEENPSSKFQKFLSSSGGHCGGWSEQDHFLFLKQRKKSSGMKFIAAVQFLLPDLNVEDIIAHEEWFKKYEQFKNSHKNAVQKWKREKKRQNDLKIVNATEKKKMVSLKKGVCRQKIAHKITKWKQKLHIKNLEEKELQDAEKLKFQQEERKKVEIQKENKKAINYYKIDKFSIIQEEIMKNKDNILPSKIKNKVLLQSFRLQDIKFAEKKRILKLQLESEINNANSRGVKLSKLELDKSLQRDPERIFKPTIIWNQHCQQKEKETKCNSLFDLNSIPKLGVPEWRKELKF